MTLHLALSGYRRCLFALQWIVLRLQSSAGNGANYYEESFPNSRIPVSVSHQYQNGDLKTAHVTLTELGIINSFSWRVAISLALVRPCCAVTHCYSAVIHWRANIVLACLKRRVPQGVCEFGVSCEAEG